MALTQPPAQDLAVYAADEPVLDALWRVSDRRTRGGGGMGAGLSGNV